MALEGEGGTAAAGGAADLLGGAAGGNDGGGAAAGSADGGSGAGGADTSASSDALPDWFEKLSAETGDGESSSNRDWAKAAGVKDLDGLVKIARDNQKAVRDSGRVKVPGEGAKPEEVAAFRTAIGVPEKIDGYEVKGPDGVQLNQPLIDAMRESALKHGAPKGAFEGLIQDFIGKQLDEANAEKTRQDDLAKKWLGEQGGKRDEQLSYVEAAARGLGLSSTDMQGLRAGLGADRALGLLAKLGAGMAEDTLITGGKGRFGVTGAEAQAEMDRLKVDPEFQKKVMIAGSPEQQRWNRLNQAAAEAKAAAEQR